MAEIFRSAFTQADLINADTVACIAGNPIKLGEYVVPAGELVSIGYGTLNGQQNATGRIYADLQSLTDDVAAAVDGLVRISAFSPQDRPKEILREYRTETLRQNETDRTKQVPFEEHQLAVSEDKKIVFEFIADANVTVNKSKSKILMDITKQVF